MAQLIASNDTEQDNIDDVFEQYAHRVAAFEKNITEFPLDSNNIIKQTKYLPKKEVYTHMQQCYPLIHGSILLLAHHFINIKKLYGTNIEKALYKNMDIITFFDRLATKRCVAFYQPNDRYLLRNGHRHSNKWNLIGTEKESEITDLDEINNITKDKKPTLNDYLSYDELIISALCGISSPTHFINDGSRRNSGTLMFDHKDKDKAKYPMECIYIGLVGARFEKSNVMEHLLMAVTSTQNTVHNGFGYNNENKDDDPKENKEEIIKILDDEAFIKNISKSKNGKHILNVFALFYGEKYLPTYHEIKTKYDNKDKYILDRYYRKKGYGNETFLDRKLFKIRIQISLELFLFDSDHRAKDREDVNGAYCYIVGIGTGVWSINKAEQDRIIVEVVKDIVNNSCLPHINVLYFGWMHRECMYKLCDLKECIFDVNNESENEYYVEDKYGHKIFVYFGQNNPGDILSKPYDKCLKVAMYAWDSNAFPGNEYYFGMLSSSGDPAAASCCTISYVQNSEINKEYINGNNSLCYFYDAKSGKYEFQKLKNIDFDNNKDEWLQKSLLSTINQRTNLSLFSKKD